jgi:hypothetical protein
MDAEPWGISKGAAANYGCASRKRMPTQSRGHGTLDLPLSFVRFAFLCVSFVSFVPLW